MVGGVVLNRVAILHNENLVGHVGDDAHVVGDQKNSRVELVTQVTHQVENFCLNRYV